MALTLAILGLLTPLVGLFVWWVKYKKAPTKAEKLQSNDDEKNDSLEIVRSLRAQNRDREADQMLARIRQRNATGWSRMQDDSTKLL